MIRIFIYGIDNVGGSNKYYSSNVLDRNNKELIKRANVKIFDNKIEAAKGGYIPELSNDQTVLLDKIKEDVRINVTIFNTPGADIRITIEPQTYIDEVLYIYGDGISKTSFYNSTNYNAIKKAEYVTLNAGGQYIYKINKEEYGEGKYNILIRDIDGRTKFVTTGDSISRPEMSFNPYPVSPVDIFYVSVDNLITALNGTGGTITYQFTPNGGITQTQTRTIYNNSSVEEFTNMNKDVRGTHRFYLERFDGAKPNPEYIQFESVPYPDPYIVNEGHTASKINIRVGNLQYRTDTGGTLKYEYFDSAGIKRGNTTTIQISQESMTNLIDLKNYNNSIEGTHSFTLVRNGDNKLVKIDVPIGHISIDNVIYNAETNQATVNVSGLYGSGATLRYTARNKNGGELEVKEVTIFAGSTQVTFTPTYVPANYKFELECGDLKTTRDNPNDVFLPIVKANMHRDKVFFVINSRSVKINTTYINGNNRTAAISVDGSLNWFQNEVTFTNNRISYSYNYTNLTQNGRQLEVGIKANEYELKYEYTVRKETSESEVDTNGNYKIETLPIKSKNF